MTFKNLFLALGAAQLSGFTAGSPVPGSTDGTCNDFCTSSIDTSYFGTCRELVNFETDINSLTCDSAIPVVNGICGGQCSCTKTQIANLGLKPWAAAKSELYWSQNRASCIQLCEEKGLYPNGRFKCKAVEFTGKQGGSHAGKCELHFRRPNAPSDSDPAACQYAKCLVNKGLKFKTNGNVDLGTSSVNEGVQATCADGEYVLYAPRFTDPGNPASNPVASPADPAALAIGYELRRSTGASIDCTNAGFGSGVDPAPGYLKQCTCYPAGIEVEKKGNDNGCCRFNDAEQVGCNA